MYYSGYKVRPCVSVTVSGFRVFSGKCTGKTDNQNTNILVHFRHLSKRRKSVIFGKSQKFRYNFRNFWPFLEPFWPFLEPKMYRNVPEMSKTSKIDGYFRHFWHLSKIPVHFRHLSKIPVHFRYIPVHFREILYRESPVDFRKIFDRRKFSTFGYRELSKVKNFRQTHGLSD